TVGDTQNLVGLATDLGSRLDVLQNLERQVRGAAQDIAASVSERLDHEASGRDDRDRALVDRLASTINESRATVSELADRLDAIAAPMRPLSTSRPDHGPRFEQLGHAISELRDAQPDLRPQLEQLGQAIAELRDAQPDSGDALQRLTAIVAALPSEHIDPS